MIAVMQITVTVRTLAKYKYQPKKITVALVENELEFEDENLGKRMFLF